MSCKLLLFEYRDTEKPFFDKNKLENFEIKFYRNTLNEKTLPTLTKEEFENTSVLSVYKFSKLNKDILERFKNLRIIALRTDKFNHVDLSFCLEKNIAVINSKEVNPGMEYHILKKNFEDITGIFCGCRDSRII